MNNLKNSISLIGTMLIAFLFTSNIALAARLDGTWVNIDANTRGLTKVMIANNNGKIYAWGKCHPSDCKWGSTGMYGSGNNFNAKYDQGFAVKRLSIAKLRNGNLCVIVKAKYNDGRRARTNTYFFKKKPARRPSGGGHSRVKEDCVKIDYKTAKVKRIGGRYKIVDGPTGSHYAFDFGSKKSEAYKALHLVKCYKITQSCFVGRPGPSLEYVLSRGAAPRGATRGEDCIAFNPRAAQVKKLSGRYKIVQGGMLMFDFGSNKNEAYQALAVIQKHGFTQQCFVGRPNPSFEYMRK